MNTKVYIARMKRCAVAVLLAAAAVAGTAGTPESGRADAADLQRQWDKAQRFFNNAEWLNASAMYTLILSKEPRERDVYSYAIVSHYMSRDTVGAVALMQQAMDNRVPLDTLLSDVRRTSMVAGSGTMYENLLLQARRRYPYLVRSVNGHLLDYYNYRDNGPLTVKYAQMMLDGAPNNLGFMQMLARGYMLCGEMEKAAGVWHSILHAHPDNREALIDLGSYYYTTGKRDLALPLLEKANAQWGTPYLQKLIGEMRGEDR